MYIELKDTVTKMLSYEYNDHFVAEYHQLAIRIENIERVLERYNNEELLDFIPKNCPKELLELQLLTMKSYLNILKKRSELEKIDVGKTILEL